MKDQIRPTQKGRDNDFFEYQRNYAIQLIKMGVSQNN